MFRRAICFGVNSLCCLMYRREYLEFARLLDIDNEAWFRQEAGKLQERKLFQILRENQSCEFGKRHGFKNLRTVKQFQENVPISVYEDYLEDIRKIGKAGTNVLTGEKVLLFEPSSGTTSASKLVPYTKSLKKEFQNGIRPWIYDLYSNVQGIKWGRSYWCITPVATGREVSQYSIPVGFEDDKGYFGSLEQVLFSMTFAVQGSVSRAKTMDDFYTQTALGLLSCPDLTLISIWNPSFFVLLLEYIENNSARLIEEIMRRNRRRGSEIQVIIASKAYDKLWKDLKVISCWADVHARFYAKRLHEIFPNVQVQPKGLLSTEGFVSFPLSKANGSVLSLKSHFFEFLSLDDHKIYLASELEMEREYAVVLTTSGGLYRYQLKDIVRVSGFAGFVPLIQFVGKQDKVSDLAGEKLNERFVDETLKGLRVNADFLMLAPESDHYELYIRAEQWPNGFDNQLFDKIEERIDNGLRANFHYDYCRRLGQLKPVRVFRVNGNPEQDYVDECVKRGQRLGDIKPVALHLQGGWHQVFQGNYL